MTPLDQVRKPIYTIAFDEEAKGARPPLCLLEQSAKNLNGVVSPTLAGIPSDVLDLIIRFEPSITQKLHQTNKALKGSVEDIYLKYSLWDKIKNLPNISIIVEGDPFFIKQNSVGEKIKRLISMARAMNPSWPRELRGLGFTEARNFCNLSKMIPFNRILEVALSMKNEELAKHFLTKFGVEFLDQIDTYHALKAALQQGISLSIIDPLLSHLGDEYYLIKLLPLLYEFKPTLVEPFFQRKRFNMDKALCFAAKEGKPDLIRFIVSSNNPYSTSFTPYAGIEIYNEERGLQRAMMVVVDQGNTESLEALISAEPSLEILKHAKKRAVFCHLMEQAEELFPGGGGLLNGRAYLTSERYRNGVDNEEELDRLHAQIPEPFRSAATLFIGDLVPHQNHREIQELLDRAIAQRSQDDDVKETPPPLVDEEIPQAVLTLVDEEIPQAVLAADDRNLQRREGIEVVRVINFADDVHDAAYRNRVLAVSTAVLLLALIWQFSSSWGAE